MDNRYQTFTTLITGIGRNIRKIKNSRMEAYGLRSIHVSCLYELYCVPGQTATDLCLHCQEDKATISRALSFLEQRQYVTCRAKTPKRYNAPYSLTAEGEILGQQIAASVESVLSVFDQELTEQQRIELYRNLTLVNDRLESLAVSASPISISEALASHPSNKQE